MPDAPEPPELRPVLPPASDYPTITPAPDQTVFVQPGREPVIITVGPLSNFTADLDNPRTWKGISRRDQAALAATVAAKQFAPSRIHTFVPIGATAPADGLELMPRQIRHYAAMWKKRIDLVYFESGTWYTAEIKPFASYVALGQTLVYNDLARREYPELANARPVIITHAPDPDILPLARRLSVRIIRDPEAIYQSPHFEKPPPTDEPPGPPAGPPQI